MHRKGKPKEEANLLTPKWPDALPSSQGSKFVFGLNCGNTSLSWSLLNREMNLSPAILWTTNPPKMEGEDADVFNLLSFLPDAIQRDMMATVPRTQRRNTISSNAELCRALTLHRETVLTVYLLSSNKVHEEAAIKLFDGLPAVIYRLTAGDFLQHDPNLSAYDTMGTDRIAGLMGARLRFPERRSHLVIDGGTALTTTTITDNRLGGTIGCGPRIKLAALASVTATLPKIDEDSLADLMQNLKLRDGRLETFVTSNTIESIAGFVLRETTLTLAHYIEEWRKSLPDDIPREQTPIVVLCGGDGQLLSRLLRPNHDDVFCTDSKTMKFLQKGEYFDRLVDCDIPESADTAFQVVFHKHLIHSGIYHVLKRQIMANTQVNVVRDYLVGQRIVAGEKRGTILSVKRSEDTEGLNEDMMRVFVEEDNHVIEMNMTDIVEGLQKYSQVGEDSSAEKNNRHTILMLNKMKDALEALTSVRTLLEQPEDSSKQRATNPLKEPAPPKTVQAPATTEEGNPKNDSQQSAKKRPSALEANAAPTGNEQPEVQESSRVLDALFKLYDERKYELDTLLQMSDVDVKALLEKKLLKIHQTNPKFIFKSEEQMFMYLDRVNTRMKAKKEKSTQSSSANSASLLDSSSSKISKKRSEPLPASEDSKKEQPLAKKKAKRDDTSLSLSKKRGSSEERKSTPPKMKKKMPDEAYKEALVGQRVAKYFRNEENQNQLYRGKVVDFFPSKDVEIGVDLWLIRFDDGDEEDVDHDEVMKIIAQYKKHKHEFMK